ncbi:PHB depolymerase family esterase [Acidovorax sp. Leaf78]|uniref:extracellular catalytic domain type 1 short-chain-length polyhydroxyalkanoate depolymerase n=1 Tax=unclassified Acidovorax TaxID=2684926 RepID=UPI0006F4492E|nr:PHB depolymerase family esterase [Acidovorax sp. Leaf78]KQO19788.1 phospholipase [Acidovorax sp. Leaf78]
MARRSRMFSLSALTRAYQRNLKALVRATGPVRTPKKKVVKVVAPLRAAAVASALAPAAPRSATSRARKPRVPAVRGEWLAGVAPGPAGARRYHLFVPPGLVARPGETFPLLVMLHGCGQTGRDLAVSSRMNRLAARERFLVLYPEQERVANAHGCWNWFERRSGKAEAEAATLLAAVDKVASRHPVDLSRVAVAGLSAGASMAVLMAATYPHRFCAVAMHSGVAPGTAESAATAMAAMGGRREAQLPEPVTGALPPVAAAPAGRARPAMARPAKVARTTAAAAVAVPAVLPPLLLLHGDADNVVSVRNATATAALWAEKLGARPGAARTLQRGQRHATQVTEFKARGRTVVALREVVGLAHAWSGGAADQPYSDPVGPDASALIWAFVAKQFDRRKV